MLDLLNMWFRQRLAQIRAIDRDSEHGATVVETVIITAAFAALALAVMAAIVALVNGKVGSISL